MECSDCGQDKPERSFATFRDRSGLVRRRGICKVCRGSETDGEHEAYFVGGLDSVSVQIAHDDEETPYVAFDCSTGGLTDETET